MEIPGADWHVRSDIWYHGEDPAAPFCSQAPPPSSRPARAGRCSSFFRRIAIAYVLYVCLGTWWIMKTEDHAEKSARPPNIDWVEAGVVSPVVRNQNSCGCCWAIAVAASVEAVHYLKTLQSTSLSVQELIDCDETNNGCAGGSIEHAIIYIRKNGLSSESFYQYMAQRSISGCKRDKTAGVRISDFRHVSQTEDALEKAVAKQPVVVSLQNAASIWNYKGGIIEYEAWPSTLPDGSIPKGHSVLIVGYGTDPKGVKYWRFKNSWGVGWGEGGFGRIRRHVADMRGVLGMFMYPALYPVLNI